jgi:hypothetical protein
MNRTAWMLATSFTRGTNNAPNAIFANDPFTGQQVRINPVTKRVVTPAKFPLKQFTIDRIQTITVNSL